MKRAFVAGVLAGIVCVGAAQEFEITGIGRDGTLTWTHPYSDGVFQVEWAPGPAGPWFTSWEHLVDLSPDAVEFLGVPVPVCYRVGWVPDGTRGGAETGAAATREAGLLGDSGDVEVVPFRSLGKLGWVTDADSTYRVEWASSPDGPWSTDWISLLEIPLTASPCMALVPAHYRVTCTGSCSPSMAYIPAGTFTMGDTYGVGARDERPVHDVYVSAFLVDRMEVTNAEMAEVMQWAFDRGLVTASSSTVRNSEGSQQDLLDLLDSECQISFGGGVFGVDAGKEGFPCVEVSWYGAQAYCNYRSDREGLPRCIDLTNWSCDFTKNGYRLPTEAEWEKAARGGRDGHYYPWPSDGGSYADHIDGSRANYSESGDPYESAPYPRTTPVGYYAAWGYGDGLYDMAGNVWEWCWDWYGGGWYGNAAAVNPDTTGPAGPPRYRVLRGGSWGSVPDLLRCAGRNVYYPSRSNVYSGFRSARGL